MLDPGTLAIEPGAPLTVVGTGFTPGSPVSAFWNGDPTTPVASTTADGAGAVELVATLPPGTSGNGALCLMDAEGRSQIAVVTVAP